jgi:hypothetical protein
VLALIEGTYGTGKTLLATWAALHSDVKVMANYEIKSPLYSPLSLPEVADSKEPLLAILDEAYIYLESRTSGKDVNIYMSYLLFQSRKRGVDFILTQQLNKTIDVRFREMADVRVLASKSDKGFSYDVFNANEDYLGNWEIPMALAETKIFPFYSTYQTINPGKDMAKELTLVEPSDVQATISKIISDLESEAPLKVWTKSTISDYCLEHLYPGSYADKVYARIKRMGNKETYKN